MYYEIATRQYAQMLKNLLVFMEKASASADQKKFDPQILLQARLAPDQFPFVRQVQIACDQAKGLAARLTGHEPPKHEDVEQSFAQLRARIQKTLDYLGTFRAEQFVDCEKREITLPFRPGKAMNGRDYTVQFSLPNMYFHVTTAYAILRHNGVEVGKGDYIGHLDEHAI